MYRATVGDEKVVVTLYDHGFLDCPIIPSMACHCSGFMLLYSVTSEKSFELMQTCYEDLAPMRKTRPVMVCGNNCDHDGRVISREQGEAYAKEIGAVFMEVSADGNINLGECFQELARMNYEWDIAHPRAQEEPTKKKKKRKKCCVC